jgi:translation initiation factor 2 alpha subunit (eIF-2alpha)
MATVPQLEPRSLKAGMLVSARVVRLTTMGCYVALPQYGDREAFILYTELWKEDVARTPKSVAQGNVLWPCRVMIVHHAGFVDLSVRRAPRDDDDDDDLPFECLTITVSPPTPPIEARKLLPFVPYLP